MSSLEGFHCTYICIILEPDCVPDGLVASAEEGEEGRGPLVGVWQEAGTVPRGRRGFEPAAASQGPGTRGRQPSGRQRYWKGGNRGTSPARYELG